MICLGILLAVVPLIGRNVEHPNLIVYFNQDEGFLMDLIWYYYSGEKRDSFQYESDYGVELLYLADFSRLFLSKFLNLTPGIFVLLMRCLHLFFWIAALLELWRLVQHHFGSYWQALLAVILLAVSPAFPHLTQSSKPDAVVLFFMILGLDYSLRIINNPSWKNLIISIACASVATLIKFAGIFLLPVIVMAMYFVKNERESQIKTFPKLKIAWILPALLGLILITMPLALICFYVRQTSGITWYKQFGLRDSLLHSSPITFSLIAGTLLIAFSFAIRILNRDKNPIFKKVDDIIQLLLSYSTIVFLLFVLFSLLFGFRWLINFKYFIQTLATFGVDAQIDVASAYKTGFLLAIFKHLLYGMKQFGIPIIVLFILYLFVEIRLRFMNLKEHHHDQSFFKRVILVIFVLEGIVLMCLPIRFTQYHMLPFFVASIILTFQTIRMAYLFVHEKGWQKNATLSFITILLLLNFIQNINISINLFRYMYRWREDVVFDIASWWRKHYSADTSILADHPTYVYLPPEYKNVVLLKFQKDKVKQLRDLVASLRPQLVYYNAGIDKNSVIPAIKEILPNNEAQLVASFNSIGKRYRRYPYSDFLIYKIKY